jgi:Zn-dependent peptidase ImmA (M78 family)/transcriptional regulator with XRE-family HTH domain
MALTPKEIGTRIREVREQVGIEIQTIAEALGVDVRTVKQLEAGDLAQIPGDYILIISRLLQTDFRYFVSNDLDDVETETRQLFRKLSTPTPSDLLAIRRFVSFCMAETDLETLLSIERSRSLPSYVPGPDAPRLHRDQGKEAARQERKRLQLGNRPIDDIFALLRSQGIHLFRHSLEDRNLSGVTIQHPKAGVCVLINYDDDLYRQFFSAAHEYCHVLADRDLLADEGCVVSYQWSRDELVELRANAFAAEFLLPGDALKRYARPNNLDDVSVVIRKVALDYRVNAFTVAIRLKELNWISDRTLESFKRVRPIVISRREKSDPDLPSDLTSNQIERRIAAIKEGISSYYLELLRRALTENVITFGRFAEMLDMTTDQARDFTRATRLAI